MTRNSLNKKQKYLLFHKINFPPKSLEKSVKFRKSEVDLRRKAWYYMVVTDYERGKSRRTHA